MFVSVILDPGSTDNANALSAILVNYGFKKVQRACWENAKIDDDHLADLKRDIDNSTNYYDTVRIYQFPVDGMFAVTEMRNKKWKRGLFAAGNIGGDNDDR